MEVRRMNITLEEFVKRFKPIENPNGNNAVDEKGNLLYPMFESYNLEDKFLMKCYGKNHVWTCVKGDEEFGLLAGIWSIDRLFYVITEVAWNEKDEELWIHLWEECGTENGCVCDECSEYWDKEKEEWITRTWNHDLDRWEEE